MEELLEVSERLVSGATGSFRRSLYDTIHWNERLIGIKGARGVGKITMLLQWLHEQKRPTREAAYFSLDELYFTTHRLVDTARDFFQRGGQILVLDEVHKYPGWAREIKNIYDQPKKVYLQNTNLLYALSEAPPEIGPVRKVFFNN